MKSFSALRTAVANLRELQQVKLAPVHATRMARTLFQTYLAAGVFGMGVVSPFLAGNPSASFIIFALVTLAAWQADRIAARGRPARAMHLFSVFLALAATLPGIILGRNLGLAAVIVFSFVPAYAAIVGMLPAVIFVAGLVAVSIVYAQLIEFGLALPVVFPMPLPAQLATITVCAFVIIVPMPALFRSINEERQRADQELDARKRHEAQLEIELIERKRQEVLIREAQAAAEVASEAKSAFLANVSHEIRTPMNGILGMTDLVLASDLTAEQREFLGNVKSSAESLLTIINDILDFSKIEAGKLTIEQLPCDVRRIAVDVMQPLALAARTKHLGFRHEITADLPTAVIADPIRLRQILLNLIGNALKFTHQGEIVVALSRRADPQLGEALHFSVKDTGIGIPADRLPRVFDAFTQADDSTTRRYGGTGLGLTITRRLIELLGGRIWVKSAPGKGSDFQFTIPLRPAAASPAATSRATPAAIPHPGAKILLVEDQPVNQTLFAVLLRRRGYEVAIVDNGVAAIAAFSATRYDLVLMDMHMPEMDGVEATATIRAMEKTHALPRIPIVAMTANAEARDREQCLAAGMDDYIAKPIKADTLFATVARWLN